MSFDSNELECDHDLLREDDSDTVTSDSVLSLNCTRKYGNAFVRALRKQPPAHLKSYHVTTPDNILELYHDKLTIYEHQEITQYPEIYYFGERALSKLSNYDSPDGYYQCSHFDHIAYRYEVWQFVARSGFSTVLKAYDHKDRQFVAIKIIRNRRFHFYDVHNEIQLLQFIKNQAETDEACRFSFVQMRQTFNFRGYICIDFEHMSTDLFELMRPITNRGFSLNLVQHIGSALIFSVHTLHRHKIVHCDLKPENLMLRNHGRTIKLTDFGLSCFFDQLDSGTAKQTLHFCAPETLLVGKITPKIDMWSVGCILAELYTGQTLLKGEDSFDQLTLMMELLGTPPKDVLSNSKAAQDLFYENGVPKYCHCLEDGYNGLLVIPKNSPSGAERGLPASRPISDALNGCADSTLIDLVTKCLDWNPDTRISADGAIRHNFFKRRPAHSPFAPNHEFPAFSVQDTIENSISKQENMRSTISAPF